MYEGSSWRDRFAVHNFLVMSSSAAMAPRRRTSAAMAPRAEEDPPPKEDVGCSLVFGGPR